MHTYRPQSPHLFIYKPQFSSICSVAHRATGSLLAIILTLGAAFLRSAICNITYYPIYSLGCSLSTDFTWFVVGGIALLFYGFFYHFSNGIRHLVWDSSYAEKYLEKDLLYKSSYAVILATVTLGTLAIFICI